jgi:CheY-like chemotaxis protein
LDSILQAVGRPAVDDKEEIDQSPASLSGLSILLVEDGLVNQRVALGLLHRMGHAVELAENGRHALEAWRERKFDLILMDLQMPDMDGIEATRIIRAEEAERGVQPTGSHIPIIAMTAAAMKGDRERCLEAGMDDYISKPISVPKLNELLQDYVGPTENTPKMSQHSRPISAQAESNVIDLSVAKERLGGCSDAMLLELAETLIEECPSRIKELEQSLAKQDSERVRRAAHTLKGAVAVFGAKEVFATAEEIELEGQEGRLSTVAQLLDQLRTQSDRLMEALRALGKQLVD